VRCGPRDYARLAQGAGAVSVRTRGKGDRGSMPLGEFIVKAKGLVESKSAALQRTGAFSVGRPGATPRLSSRITRRSQHETDDSLTV
jgi:hypothetical protein